MKKTINVIALILLIIGGLNWGLVGFFNIDIVAMIFGSMTMLARLVYALVGIAAVVKIFCLFKCGCKGEKH